MNEITATDVFFSLAGGEKNLPLIDVRSESEFLRGSVPGAVNVPILNNEHRHLVGTMYKQKGQEDAVALGHQLVNPIRSAIIAEWREKMGTDPAIQAGIFCWRGGMRSKIACEWLEEHDLNISRVVGGFKALRTLAIEEISKSRPFLIVGGSTGSAKTKLLKKFRDSIDLEGLCRHRGSAFGRSFFKNQPTQIEFENGLAITLIRKKGILLIEDESRYLGRCILPPKFYNGMSASPMVLIEESDAFRESEIFRDYVEELFNAEVSAPIAMEFFLTSLTKIKKNLGGLKSSEAESLMRDAFSCEKYNDEDRHRPWISLLLKDYYDPLYLYSRTKKSRHIKFSGTWQECYEFLQDHFTELNDESN